MDIGYRVFLVLLVLGVLGGSIATMDRQEKRIAELKLENVRLETSVRYLERSCGKQ